jgi:hypothetical protein
MSAASDAHPGGPAYCRSLNLTAIGSNRSDPAIAYNRSATSDFIVLL